MPLEGGKENDAGVSWEACLRRAMLRFRNIAIGRSKMLLRAMRGVEPAGFAIGKRGQFVAANRRRVQAIPPGSIRNHEKFRVNDAIQRVKPSMTRADRSATVEADHGADHGSRRDG